MTDRKGKTMQTYTIDGKKCEFDVFRFRYCFEERYQKENRSLPSTRKNAEGEECKAETRKTKEALRREIAECVHVTEDAVKNWLRTKNGNAPGDEEKVYDLEDFFHVERGYFLKPVLNEKENTHMNTAYTVQKTDNHELEAAKSLYISILETIDAHEVHYPDFIKGLPWGNIESIPDACYGMSKERYKLILAIRKTAMDLPESVRLSAMELVNDIYGPELEDEESFYETEDFKAYVNTDEYRACREKWKADGMSNMEIQYFEYTDYNAYKTAEFYRRLDEIFADYIKR